MRRFATWEGSKVWVRWVGPVRLVGPNATRVVCLGAVGILERVSFAIPVTFVLVVQVPLRAQGGIAQHLRDSSKPQTFYRAKFFE